jgi:hypothetical protein
MTACLWKINIKTFTFVLLLYLKTPPAIDNWDASDLNFLIDTIRWIIVKAIIHDPREVVEIARCKTLITEK